MKKTILTFDECLAMAQDFLTTKQRGCFYRFTALDDNYDSEYCCDNELSADDVARLRVLKDKYGNAFVGHLDEVFSDPDVIYDFTGGDEILAIDLANVNVSLAQFQAVSWCLAPRAATRRHRPHHPHPCGLQ